MSLKEYTRKRNFKTTAEPKAKVVKGLQHSFVIQNHDASRLHYDLRLKMAAQQAPGCNPYSGALGNDAASLLEQARELGLETHR